MKIICPGHYCVLEEEDKYLLENNVGAIEAIPYDCPFCKAELLILDLLASNVRILPAMPVTVS